MCGPTLVESAAMPKFPFDKEFQVKILSLMLHDFEFLIFSHELVKPSYFSDDVLSWFFKKIRDYFIDFQMKADDVYLRNEMKKAAARKQIKAQEVQAYFQAYKKVVTKYPGRDYLIAELTAFCRHQAIKKAALEMPGLLQKGDFDAIEEVWKETFTVGVASTDLGIQYFPSWPQRLGDRIHKLEEVTIPTGITTLDKLLSGGLKAGQLGLWMAPTGRGKSVVLVHCGKRALVMGKKVIHYTMELSGEDVAERYDASFSKIPVRRLIDEEPELAKKLENLGQRMGNSLIIKEFPTKVATVGMLKSHIMQCVASGFVPDLLIFDYIDLLKPSFRRKEKREELTDITEETRGLCGELKIPGWSATQSRRAAISKETHDEEDIAEDIGKINTADIGITLNQTKKEAEEGIMRLLVAKNRNGPRYVSVTVQTDFSRMIFYVPPRAGKEPKPIVSIGRKKKVKKRPPPKTEDRKAAKKPSTNSKPGKAPRRVPGKVVKAPPPARTAN